jgi:hypothetical protein
MSQEFILTSRSICSRGRPLGRNHEFGITSKLIKLVNSALRKTNNKVKIRKKTYHLIL